MLVVVIGAGKLVVPVDCTVRRPDPEGPGGPCRDQRTWLQVMLDRTWTALQRRCRRLPPPLVMADSWLGDSGLMAHVATAQRGTLLVEGKTSQVFHRPDGPRVKGHDWRSRSDWPWRASLHLPGGRDARLTVSRPTYGVVTVTEACQVQMEDAYVGPLVLRLLAGLVLLSTARIVLKGQVTMEERLFSLKQHWRFLDSEPLELPALSWDLHPQVA